MVPSHSDCDWTYESEDRLAGARMLAYVMGYLVAVVVVGLALTAWAVLKW